MHAVLQVPTGKEAVMVRKVASALNALRGADVRSMVRKLASAGRPAPCNEPGFVANAAIEALVRYSGIPFTIVQLTMYRDNLQKPNTATAFGNRPASQPRCVAAHGASLMPA